VWSPITGTRPVNALGYLRVMFAVDDIDEALARLRKRGAQLVGEVVQYEDSYRLRLFDARRKGKPRILHIRRDEADANRRASLRGIATKPGFDRDEYPPAMSDERGKAQTCATCGAPRTAAPAR
jgi:hypothetical protein